MKKIISLILFALFLTACSAGYETIDSRVAKELMTGDALVIDVRTSEEYDTGHIEGSINIPVDMISSVSYDKNDVIIVYCATGMRSAQAAKKLSSMGYTTVYNLDGGLINWGNDLVQ